MQYLYFTNKTPESLLENRSRKILNFFNFHNAWWFFNNKKFREHMIKRQNVIFADSVNIARLKKIKVNRGPVFTRNFLKSKEAKKTKHFFINLKEVDRVLLSNITGIPLKNIFASELPFVKEIEFPQVEVLSLAKKINSSKVNFVWNFIASPKQEILSNQLFPLTKTKYFFNVGAAGDFLLNKKKEAPNWTRKIGMEWFYRFVTDFKYSKKKVWRSLISIKYLNKIKVRNG